MVGQFLEHLLIIPARWWRQHWRNCREQRQRCKVCGYRDKFDWTVPEALWRCVVPLAYRRRVVCLSCFDGMAAAQGIDYADCLTGVVFVGDRQCFGLRVERRWAV